MEDTQLEIIPNNFYFIVGLVRMYMCACLYQFGMSGHHQMHFIDVHIIVII